MKSGLAIVATLAAPFVAGSARAEPLQRGALRLEWTAPGGCPNGVEVVDRIEALLGSPVASLEPEPITARGSVKQLEPLRFELELETAQKGARFARSMQAPSCAELTDAGALVLALAIDPTLAERQSQAAEARPLETEAQPTAPPPLPPPPPAVLKGPVRNLDSPPERDDFSPKESTPSPSVPEWAARIGLALDLGTVADVGYGPKLTVGAGFGALRPELGLVWLVPQRTVIADNPEQGGDIDLVAGDLSGCALPLRGALEFQGCAVVELGRLHGKGFGTAADDEGSRLWVGTGLSAFGRWAATEGLSVALDAGFLYNPQDTEFTLKNVGLVHRVPAAVGRFGLSLETEFE